MTLKVVNTPTQDSGAQASSGAATGVPDAPPVVPATARTPWHDRLAPGARWVGRQLSAPRTRLCVVGIVLLLIGIVWVTDSAWTLPLIVVGIAMVIVAWMGSRLDGRFAIEWGEGGTQVEFRAQIKAPPPVAHGVQLHPLPAGSPPSAAPAPPVRPQIDDGNVIEGEGHTVEIDVAELKTLIRAAEAKEAQVAADGDAAAGSPDERSVA
jgi:hypothetical protein